MKKDAFPYILETLKAQGVTFKGDTNWTPFELKRGRKSHFNMTHWWTNK